MRGPKGLTKTGRSYNLLIEPAMDEELRQRAFKQRVTVATLVREALALYLRRRSREKPATPPAA